jgi:hypothetical protein
MQSFPNTVFGRILFTGTFMSIWSALQIYFIVWIQWNLIIIFNFEVCPSFTHWYNLFMTFYSHKVGVNRRLYRCDCTVEYFYLWMFPFVVQYFPFVTLKLMSVKEVDDMLYVCTPLKHETTLTDLKNMRQIQSTLFSSWLSSWLFWFHDPAFLGMYKCRTSKHHCSIQPDPYVFTVYNYPTIFENSAQLLQLKHFH